MWPHSTLFHDPKKPTDIYLWLTRFDPSANILPLLTPSEQEKAETLTLQRRREEYITTRALQRHALATQTGVPPHDLSFGKGVYGKPNHPLSHFNLSNCAGLVACLVASDAVGQDIEPHDRGAQVLEVAKKVFTPKERDALDQLPLQQKQRAAIELWTLKEAVMKATGYGFTLAPSSFELSTVSDQITVTSDTQNLGGPWHLSLTILGTEHALSIATRMPRPNIETLYFSTPYKLGL